MSSTSNQSAKNENVQDRNTQNSGAQKRTTQNTTTQTSPAWKETTKTDTAGEEHNDRLNRILNHCRFIYGTTTSYDLELQKQENNSYVVIVRKDYGSALGPKEIWTKPFRTVEGAWENLELMMK